MARAPAHKLENTTRLLPLSPHHGTGELDSRVTTERLVPDAENHVIDFQDAVGGRALGHLGDQDLAGIGSVFP